MPIQHLKKSLIIPAVALALAGCGGSDAVTPAATTTTTMPSATFTTAGPVPSTAAAAEKAAPKAKPLTSGQRNALKKAESYLGITGFSRKGLIEQLKFDDFSTSEATYAVDHVTVNWNDQAVKKAKSYLDITSFSRSGLIEQLEFDGFTPSQARHGAKVAY